MSNCRRISENISVSNLYYGNTDFAIVIINVIPKVPTLLYSLIKHVISRTRTYNKDYIIEANWRGIIDF